MKNLLWILTVLTTFASCGLDPRQLVPEDFETDEETALRLKYTELLRGEWQNSDTTENSRMYEYIKFSDDARAVHIARIELRNYVSKNPDGIETCHPGWELIMNDTLTGRWYFTVGDNDTLLNVPGCSGRLQLVNDTLLKINLRIFNELRKIKQQPDL